MIVADTSYLVEAILRDASLLENDETIITPDLTVYETINTLWKHEVLIGDLKDSSPYLELLLELISTEAVQLVRPDEKLLKNSYMLSAKHKTPIYDAVLVALALELGLKLKTFDRRQTNILSKEKGE
ncbi:type II toxin-antitoxin system VapC family toxin [Candidatus Bathyarchaeota archaeon]|nr:type II toxin-antitoxin system VapC family toxin [Candidatus Bathyarchaeota archaeon]